VDKVMVTIEAAQSITLKVGSSTIVMDPSSITLKSLTITSEAQVLQKAKGAMTEIEGATMTTVKGGVVKIN